MIRVLRRPIQKTLALLLVAVIGCGSSEGVDRLDAESRSPLDGVIISSAASASLVRGSEFLAVADTGPIDGTFRPRLTVYWDDGREDKIAIPIEHPLLGTYAWWTGSGLAILGATCKNWQETAPKLDLQAPAFVQAACGSSEVVLLQWTPGSTRWRSEVGLFEAPDLYRLDSTLNDELIIKVIANPDGRVSRVLRLRAASEAVTEVANSPLAEATYCLQDSGGVIAVGTESEPPTIDVIRPGDPPWGDPLLGFTRRKSSWVPIALSGDPVSVEGCRVGDGQLVARDASGDFIRLSLPDGQNVVRAVDLPGAPTKNESPVYRQSVDGQLVAIGDSASSSGDGSQKEYWVLTGDTWRSGRLHHLRHG